MGGSSTIMFAVIHVALLAGVACLPLPEDSQDAELVQKAKAALVEKLETDLVQAAALGGIAEAVKLEQKFEEQILKAAVKTLTRDRGDPEKQARDMVVLNELVRRDKRAVELLTGVLGSSSGGGDSSSSSNSGGSGGIVSGLLGSSSGGNNAADGEDGGGGSNLLSLVTGVLGSSSGGGNGGNSDDGGGGSNLLSLIPSLLGSSSGGGSDSEDGGGGSNLLSLIPSLLGSSSGGGGDSGSEGGGSNALSLISGILGSSSGGGTSDSSSSSGGGFRPLGNVFDQKLNLLNVGGGDDVLKGGTYDDLIGKSGSSNFIGAITNTVSAVLRAKFNVFKSLFSSLTSGLLGRLGGGAAT